MEEVKKECREREAKWNKEREEMAERIVAGKENKKEREKRGNR